MKKLYLVPTIILAGSLLLCSTPPAQAQVDPFGSALDGSGLAYTTGGLAQWFVQTTTTHDGADAAQSGQIGDGGESYIQTTITGPDRLRFWWKVSSESNYDYLSFLVDYNFIQTISGDGDWEQVIYDIPAGSHTITWNYTKDVSIATGSDAGFLDEVRLASQTNETIITSPLTVTGTQNGFFSYQITATLNPQTFTATPLPAGLSLNSSGLLSGFPTGNGTIEVNISATGPAGTANAILTIDILEPAITSPTGVAATRGEFFSYKITATHNVQSFTATPLPAWLSLNSSGLLSGFPTGSGTINVNISATGPAGTANAILTIYIQEPVITSPLGVGATRGEFFSYQITATHNIQSFMATPLPAWLSLNSSGLLSGFPTGSGTINVNISATGPAGTANAILTIYIQEPYITSPIFVGATRGELFSYQITATGNPNTFTATPLPAGLTLNSSGLLSGFPTGSGTINVNISATGAAGTANAILAIYILEPTITSPLAATAMQDELFSYQITATGNPQTFTATPRPGWLSL
ncbi:MAG: putative Ig domain-containing protein, partial [Verrucomicrobiales bacterium]